MLQNYRLISRKIGTGSGALLLAGLLLAGCGAKSGESTPTPRDAVEVPAPTAPAVATPSPTDFTALLQQVASASDLFSWYSARESYLSAAARSPEVDAALAAKETELLAKSPARAFNDALELLAFDWKLDGDNSAEGKKENFTGRWLFHKKGPVTLAADEEVQLILRGWPDKAHQNYLEGVGQADNKYFELSFSLKPRLADVENGAYFLVERKTYKQLPNVPYRMHTFFSQMKKKEDGSWGYVGRFGESADLGWVADAGK